MNKKLKYTTVSDDLFFEFEQFEIDCSCGSAVIEKDEIPDKIICKNCNAEIFYTKDNGFFIKQKRQE